MINMDVCTRKPQRRCNKYTATLSIKCNLRRTRNIPGSNNSSNII